MGRSFLIISRCYDYKKIAESSLDAVLTVRIRTLEGGGVKTPESSWPKKVKQNPKFTERGGG